MCCYIVKVPVKTCCLENDLDQHAYFFMLMYVGFILHIVPVDSFSSM